jgi:hypothetical protein
VARLTADVAARLRPVCADMPPASFDALVGDVARLKHRWADAASPPRAGDAAGLTRGRSRAPA